MGGFAGQLDAVQVARLQREDYVRRVQWYQHRLLFLLHQKLLALKKMLQGPGGIIVGRTRHNFSGALLAF